jgi:hypothetical protein
MKRKLRSKFCYIQSWSESSNSSCAKLSRAKFTLIYTFRVLFPQCDISVGPRPYVVQEWRVSWDPFPCDSWALRLLPEKKICKQNKTKSLQPPNLVNQSPTSEKFSLLGAQFSCELIILFTIVPRFVCTCEWAGT